MPVIGFTDMWTRERFAVDMWRDPLHGKTWIDANGREWQIGEMETQHIIFTIRLLRRRARRLAHRALVSAESWAHSPLGAGGDMAMDAQDAELEELYDAAYFGGALQRVEESPIVREMKAELVRRFEPWGVEPVEPTPAPRTRGNMRGLLK